MEKKSTHISSAFISHRKKNLKQQVDICEAPRWEVIQNILNYSKALRIQQSHSAGLIEIILN